MINFLYLFTAILLLAVSPANAAENIWPKIEKNIWKLRCIDHDGYIYIAYGELNINPKYGGPHLDSGWNYLRLQALGFEKSYNEEKLRLIELINFDNPEFIALFKKAITWAEQEKAKSADELYQLSKTVPPQIKQERHKDNFRGKYLLLARKKGHPLEQPQLV